VFVSIDCAEVCFTMGKRKCVFNDKLKDEFKFLKQFLNDSERVSCNICGAVFSISHKDGGI
jgi:hypothetical protein